MRAMLIFVIGFHGIIHLVAFLLEFDFRLASPLNGKRIITMTGSIPETTGILWY